MSTIERTAKLSDVAKAAGVSQGTVSNVFNRPDVVREEVRERVLEVAQTLGYRGPDPKGRLLRAGKVNAIGIATQEPLSYFFHDPYAREVMAGISAECDARGAGISLVSAANGETLAWNIRSAVVDGFILFCIEGGERLIQLTRDRQLPFVSLALGIDDPTIAAIGIDNVAGGRMAAEHLLSLGHRCFAMLAMSLSDRRHVGLVTDADLDRAIYTTTRDRTRGYLRALAEAGITAGEVPVVETFADEASVREAMEIIFAAPEKPTAILTQSDRDALHAIRWLHERGYDVPGDVSVIGFDGIAEGSASMPPLTTIAQPMAETGRLAVQMILGGTAVFRRETLPLKLVVRGSTAPPHGGPRRQF
jgi:DNA-binding LacI/PurR family transcriptional regulator